MKIKRFNNLWAMGLILFGVILIAFYIAKIFFPEFIVGVAQIPTIVKFGDYVDTHKWAYYLFNFTIGITVGSIFWMACCRKSYLSIKNFLIVYAANIILIIVMMFMPNHYNSINYVVLYCTPFIICLADKKLSKETFTSTTICFSIDIFAQIFSSEIRDLFVLSSHINSATLTILLIDVWIWRLLLYLFFNYQNKKEI